MATGGMQNLGGAQFVITANTASFDAGMAKAEANARRAQKSIDGATARASAAAKRMGDDLNKSSSTAARGMLQLSYMADDIQYGFRSIVNNIPQVVMGLGGGAGLAGGVAIAAVAINQLIEHWGQLTSVFQAQWLNVPMERLEKLRLGADKAREAFEDLIKTPKAVDAAEVKALHQAIVEEGPERIMKNIREMVATDPAELGNIRQRPDIKDRLKRVEQEEEKAFKLFAKGDNKSRDTAALMRLGAADETRKINADIEKAIADRVEQIQGGLLQPGEAGREARDTFKRLFRKFANDFSPEFAKALQESSQEFLKAVERNRAAVANFVGPPFNLNAANQSAAAMMMQGPLGREVLAGKDEGGGAPAGPVTQAQAMEMLRRNKVMQRTNIRARAGLAKNLEGMTQEQAAAVMAGITPEAVDKNIRERLGGKGLANAVAVDKLPEDKSFLGAADLLQERAKEARKNPPPAAKPKPTDLEQRVQKMMDAAGIAGTAKGVIGDIKTMQEERIKQLMLERGMTQAQARAQMMRENIRHNVPGAFVQGGQTMGLVEASLFRHAGIQAGAGSPEFGRQQLDEARRSRELLEILVKQAQNNKLAVLK
jgi:hypothetical protein